MGFYDYAEKIACIVAVASEESRKACSRQMIASAGTESHAPAMSSLPLRNTSAAPERSDRVSEAQKPPTLAQIHSQFSHHGR